MFDAIIGYFTTFWSTFFGWMPPYLFIGFCSFLLLSAIIIILKLVAFIMDILPFA